MSSSVRPELGTQVLEQVQDGGLDADVERRDRLVGDQQLGPQRERPGDGDPLPLPAGELPRVGVDRLLGQAHEAEQFPGVGLDLVPWHDVVHPQQLVQHAPDRHPRVE